MEGLPDLSGDPGVRALVLARIKEINCASLEEGARLGVPSHELERIRRNGERSLQAVRLEFERKQALWN